MEALKKALAAAGFTPDRLMPDAAMCRYTTMRVGGPADLAAFPSSSGQIIRALDLAARHATPALVMGGGSNLIVRDGGVRGLVLVLGEAFSRVRVRDGVLYAQAGARLAQVGAAAQRAGLSGLEFAAGIPGTVGGGVAMNAGAYGGELKDCLLWAQVLLHGQVLRLDRQQLAMGYRTSRALREGGVVLGAAFALTPGDPQAIARRMGELAALRREKQPLSLPSAGSTFKRPPGHFAGALIEGAGLKGLRVGGAQVSEKHAGFVVNAGEATAKEVLELIQQVKDRVWARWGVALECEVRVVGEG